MEMISSNRYGYFHALEGVIAALIVVFYLTSIVSVPETTDWTPTHVSKRSEDLMSALDRSGFLDKVVARNDPESLNAMINALDSSAAYHITLDGIPRSLIDVGVAVNASGTFVRDTRQGRWGDASEIDRSAAGYRSGNLSGGPFGDVGFVLTDLSFNGITDYTSAYFDLGDDGTYEGPYNFSSRVCPGTGDLACYDLGSFNDTLYLYNATLAARYERVIGNVSLGRRRIDLEFTAVNISREDLLVYDALLASGWNTSQLARHRSILSDYLGAGNVLFAMANVTPSTVDGSYLADLGFDYLDQYSIRDSTRPETNVLYSIHGAGNLSYTANNYYIGSGISLYTFTDRGSYYEGEITIAGEDILVNVSGGTVTFQTEGFAVPHETGGRVTLKGNSYYIRSVRPLRLDPAGQQRFRGFGTGRIAADYAVTRRLHHRYNTSQYDAAANYSRRFKGGEEWAESPYSEGVVSSPCAADSYPYKLGYIQAAGANITFLLVNFELETPCDTYYEYAYFDFRNDTDFNDDADQTPLGYAGEGPHQRGATVAIKNHTYRVVPFINGNGTSLKREGPRIVGEIPVSRSAVQGSGSVALFGRVPRGDDELHLMRSLLLAEIRDDIRFTQFRSIGDTALGYTYLSTLNMGRPVPYTLNTVWWFR